MNTKIHKKYADVRVQFTVEFDDDGETDLLGQAVEAALDELGGFSAASYDIEVMWPVRDHASQRP